MNTGERDELIAILKLIEMKDLEIPFRGELIQEIKNGKVICGSLPGGTDLGNISMLTNHDLHRFAEQCGVTKAPGGAKADIDINGIGYSIKSNRSAPPALVNHTARPGFENVCNRIGIDISQLDEIVTEYWRLRKGNFIREDTKNNDANCPFRQHKEYMRPILNYFLFSGTGQSDSSYPSKYLIKFENPLNVNNWNVYDKSNALDLIWDKLIFSMRSKKGMPDGYPNNLSPRMKNLKSSVDIWTEYIDGDYRGALHIRASK